MKKAVFLALLLLVACGKSEQPAPKTASAPPVSFGNADRGKELINQYGCVGCHVVPGMGAGGNLGPSLEKYGTRSRIVQKFPNTPENLTKWIVSPQSFDPNTTMPPSGMAEADARDAAAYLLAHK